MIGLRRGAALWTGLGPALLSRSPLLSLPRRLLTMLPIWSAAGRVGHGGQGQTAEQDCDEPGNGTAHVKLSV